MKKMIFTLALTLALTNGIASPISPVAKEGPACYPGQPCLINQAKPSPISPVAHEGPACYPGQPCLI